MVLAEDWTGGGLVCPPCIPYGLQWTPVDFLCQIPPFWARVCAPKAVLFYFEDASGGTKESSTASMSSKKVFIFFLLQA